MKKYNVETETVETYSKLNNVTLLPSGKLTFNAAKVIVLNNGDEVSDGVSSSYVMLDETSDLYQAIMAEYFRLTGKIK
tara:strand:+ start:237 stop:470 length:234 start_codon:yes stop_codon:yes gene_type:complete